MLVYIPTLKRENKLITTKWIPERWKNKVILVCPAEEVHPQWDGPRLDVPRECIGSICKTRQWIIEQSADDHVGMLDDDLRSILTTARSVQSSMTAAKCSI
jgi:hypothetical protein